MVRIARKPSTALSHEAEVGRSASPARMAGEPAADSGTFVGGVLVEDYVDGLAGGNLALVRLGGARAESRRGFECPSSDVKSVTTAGCLKVRPGRRRNPGFPVQHGMPKMDRSRFIRQLVFDWFWRTAK